MIPENTVIPFIMVIGAYLVGSINFAIIFTRLFTRKDIRTEGSGNAGMTNVMRSAGILPGVLTLIFDAAKGAFCCLIAQSAAGSYGYGFVNADPAVFTLIMASACTIGHFFPIFFKFKGGKGVATAAGVLAILDFRVFLAAICVFIICLILTRIVSISSITAASSVPLFVTIFTNPVTTEKFYITVLSLIYAGLVVFKHHENISRLIRGKEKKFTFKK